MHSNICVSHDGVGAYMVDTGRGPVKNGPLTLQVRLNLVIWLLSVLVSVTVNEMSWLLIAGWLPCLSAQAGRTYTLEAVGSEPFIQNPLGLTLDASSEPCARF